MKKVTKVLLIVGVLVVFGASTAIAANKIGTDDKDRLNGTKQADAIYGLGDNDVLNGSSGDDEMSGYTGNDKLSGGAGNDTLIGGPGTDSFNTGGTATPPGSAAEDFVHSRDGLAETICVPNTTGAFSVYIDNNLDTVKGGSDCSQTIYSPSSSQVSAASEEGASSGIITNEDL